jgi:hypothetical protein
MRADQYFAAHHPRSFHTKATVKQAPTTKSSGIQATTAITTKGDWHTENAVTTSKLVA